MKYIATIFFLIAAFAFQAFAASNALFVYHLEARDSAVYISSSQGAFISQDKGDSWYHSNIRFGEIHSD